MNEELQEREIQNQMKTKTKKQRFCFYLMFRIFPLLIFLLQSAERREFQKKNPLLYPIIYNPIVR